MKRMNLLLDGQLLEEATRVLSAKSHSAAFNIALEKVIQMGRIQQLPRFFGFGIWEGNLQEMRQDRPKRGGRK
jgi:hypothetical protein